jgi:hypothetical protein
MFYFFRRGDVRLRCEVRTGPQGDGYELVIDRPDAMVCIERFEEPASLNQRWTTLERTLLREGWWGPYGRDA